MECHERGMYVAINWGQAPASEKKKNFQNSWLYRSNWCVMMHGTLCKYIKNKKKIVKNQWRAFCDTCCVFRNVMILTVNQSNGCGCNIVFAAETNLHVAKELQMLRSAQCIHVTMYTWCAYPLQAVFQEHQRLQGHFATLVINIFFQDIWKSRTSQKAMK